MVRILKRINEKISDAVVSFWIYELNKNKEKLNINEEVEKTIRILKDFGLDELDIINSIKLIGDFSVDMIKKEAPEDYIISYHAVYGDISQIRDNKNSIVHDILIWSRIGLYSDWKYSDENVLAYVNSTLKDNNLNAHFSSHDWDEEFKITIGNDKEEYSVDFQYSAKVHNMKELFNAINPLIEKFNLIYIDADNGGDDFAFLFMERGRYDKIMKKYGDEFNKILMPWKYR